MGGACPTKQGPRPSVPQGPGGAYRRRVLVDVGAIRQVDEDGVHVLHVCDDDGQVGQRGQGPGLVLILAGQKYTPSVKSCCGHAHIYTKHTSAHTTPRSTNMCPHILASSPTLPQGRASGRGNSRTQEPTVIADLCRKTRTGPPRSRGR